MARVTGIGGCFCDPKIRSGSPTGTPEHLGMEATEWGVTFVWTDEVPAGTGSTAWSTFPDDTKYIGESAQRTMINYRVDDLDALLEGLQAAGVTIDPKRDDADYGKFAWIVDCDGNRVELWQPLPG